MTEKKQKRVSQDTIDRLDKYAGVDDNFDDAVRNALEHARPPQPSYSYDGLDDLGEENFDDGTEWLDFVVKMMRRSPKLHGNLTWGSDIFADPEDPDNGRVAIEELIGGLLQAERLSKRAKITDVLPYDGLRISEHPIPWMQEYRGTRRQEELRQECRRHIPEDVKEEMKKVYGRWMFIMGNNQGSIKEPVIDDPAHKYIHMVSMAIGAKIRDIALKGQEIHTEGGHVTIEELYEDNPEEFNWEIKHTYPFMEGGR